MRGLARAWSEREVPTSNGGKVWPHTTLVRLLIPIEIRSTGLCVYASSSRRRTSSPEVTAV
jgi:hypothetical protein